MSERESSEARSESSLSPGERRSPEASPPKRSPSPARSKEPSRSRSRSRPKESPPRDANGRRSPTRSRSRSPRHNSRERRRSRSRGYDRSRGERYRSRSRSPGYRGGRRRYSRSRSRSPYDRRERRDNRRSGYRSRSTSPMSSRRRHQGNRDNPRANRCVGVFGLSLYTQERDLRDTFSRYGPIEDLQIVYDHQTGRSRGFAFVYYRNEEDAFEAKERAPGMEIDGRKIRVDFSITERAHTPTPGIYLGKPTSYGREGRGRRSPSPYYDNYRGGGRESRGHRRYSRSRSRSYSPRRY